MKRPILSQRVALFAAAILFLPWVSGLWSIGSPGEGQNIDKPNDFGSYGIGDNNAAFTLEFLRGMDLESSEAGFCNSTGMWAVNFDAPSGGWVLGAHELSLKAGGQEVDDVNVNVIGPPGPP